MRMLYRYSILYLNNYIDPCFVLFCFVLFCLFFVSLSIYFISFTCRSEKFPLLFYEGIVLDWCGKI
ncbi:hypothetical protein BDZ91DRAFT_740992 [Kalaharituber pfeilii]|nr:hypothetical protein BDZ91DRAFT_740992 [Kalaharituber pfeilii]